MPEPFKNAFNLQLITGMSIHFQSQWPAFDADAFIRAASHDLNALELKQRSDQIMLAMVEFLPADFNQATDIIHASLAPESDTMDSSIHKSSHDNGILGWAIMPIAHYVGLHGQDHLDVSMALFKALTKRFTSEFGIRFLLLKSPQHTLSILKQWTRDDDKHVRRLVSEGTRPRLPWAMRLPPFINDPAPVLELLELLKDDDEEYVRRSVANNLNDIAKDHPDIVTDIAEKWMRSASPQRQKLIRHACRTLIKQGNQKVLKIFGYEPANIQPVTTTISTPSVVFGDALKFSITIVSKSSQPQALMIDYVIHHQKANGQTSPKVFKWRIKSLLPNAPLKLIKKHRIKPITTRKYYPGLHKVEVMINGVSVSTADFQLQMPAD